MARVADSRNGGGGDYYVRVIEKLGCRRGGVEVGIVKALQAHLTVNAVLHLNNRLLLLYLQCGWDSQKLVHLLPTTTATPTPWFALITSCSRNGFHHQALHFFTQLQHRGVVSPTFFILPTLLKSIAFLSLHLPGMASHALALRRSFYSDPFVRTALIHMYSMCGRLHQARLVFDNCTDVVSLNAMVASYTHHRLPAEGARLVLGMMRQSVGCTPDLITWNSLLSGFSRIGNEAMAWQVLRMMYVHGVRPDVVSWTCVISGLVQSFLYAEAMGVFKRMIKNGSPNSATLSAILPACGGRGEVRRGREIHAYAVGVGVEKDMYVGSALVDMYAKCGCIGEAREMFERMEKRTGVSWNSMIFGYAHHGCCDDAVAIFRRMEEEDGDKVDHVTATAVIAACRHAGRVEEGVNIFKVTERRMEHYAGMVDLMGRAGEVWEAYEFIKGMPVEPDLYVWGAFLGACTRHGNIELAEKVLKHLSPLEPHSAAGAILLKSLYADVGKWEKVARLRRIMKKPKFIKFSCCSWIEAGCTDTL